MGTLSAPSLPVSGRLCRMHSHPAAVQRGGRKSQTWLCQPTKRCFLDLSGNETAPVLTPRMRNVLRRALPACSRDSRKLDPLEEPKSPGSLEKGFQKWETFVCFRLKGEAACGGEVKDLYLGNRYFFLSFFYPCCLFSSEFILLGGFIRGLRDMRKNLCNLKLRRVFLFLTLPKQRVSIYS